MNPIVKFVRHTVPALAAAAAIAAAGAQQGIGYIEEFALATDREEALKQLIPGTEDYYYFHALHYQNTRDIKKLNGILAQWDKRFRNSGRRTQIIRREMLITYPDAPAAAREFLRREMGLQFNHQQEGKAREQKFPSALNQAEISWKKFFDDALRQRNTLEYLDLDAFHTALANGHKLTAVQRRHLLSRAYLPDLPGLVGHITEDFKTKESRGFGEFNIHRALTLAQLDELRGLKPDLLRNENYVHTYLAKLRPGADENPALEPAVREAYLDRAWEFVFGLTPSFNSLKAHLLYQRLDHDRRRGVFNGERFLAYVKLPRNASYLAPEWRKRDAEAWRYPADLNKDYGSVTGLPRIGGDEPLVRAYLLHFLKSAKDYEAYAPYFSESWLKGVFAEAKIVNGIGNPEKWASLLSPAAFQALKDRVDVEFDTTSPEQFGIDDTVKLTVHVKNVETLIVKVFEVNTLNYYLERGSEISTDLDLDGLVTNHERTFEYKDAPQRRVAREFEFPEIENRRGVWVVEFIGGSKSSRAVIRKGKLGILSRTVSAGEMLTVLDESHKPLADAAVWFGGRRIECDEKGRALVPFSTDPGSRSAVVETAGGFASLASFRHPAEQYQLSADIQIDREALRPASPATVIVRPTLTVAGQPISLSRLENVRLVLTSTDLDGTVTTATVPGFELGSDREATHEFRVPDRLAGLTVQLVANVKVASQGGKEIQLSDAQTFPVNSHLRSDQVDDLYLSRIGDGFVLELLGRTGEARGGQNVNVTFRRDGFKNTRRLTLKTNEAGAITLGALADIEAITVECSGRPQRSWTLPQVRRTQERELHAVAGKPVRVPYVGALTRTEVAFYAMVGDKLVADAFDKLALVDGFLEAGDLAAGDYLLRLKESGQNVTIKVAKGVTSAGHVFSTARSLELRERAPAHLSSVTSGDKQLELVVANSDKFTRVHIFATRFVPDFDAFDALGHSARLGLASGRPAHLPNLYLSGRKIGDEFRYILERRYATKLPGNLLERPEILLNPWVVRDTEAEEEALADGEAYARKPAGAPAASARARNGGKAGKDGESGSPRSVDFLANAPTSFLNLLPGKDGTIKLDLAAFGDRQHLHILVVDPDGATYRDHALADRGTKVRDLRLVNALDPARHFTEQDSVTILKKGETLEIPDLLTAKFEVFDNLAAAHRYLLSLNNNAVLREFGFLVTWPELDEKTKKAKFSKYACHELSFFLAMKDPKFFKAVVVPYLANKRDKTFLDDYLLENDLEPYFAPYQYARLNTLERILLARRHPGRLDAIRMDLRDRLALVAPDPTREVFLFDGAIGGGGLSLDRNKGVDDLRAIAIDGLSTFDAPEGEAAAAADPFSARGAMRDELGKERQNLAKTEKEVLKLQSSESAGRKLAEKAKKKGNVTYSRKSGGDDDLDAYGDFGLVAGEIQALYRSLETTKEWAENNYYRLAIESHVYNLVPENKFWLDFANHDGKGAFGSRHLGETARNVHEMLLALAVLDLPFTAPKHKSEIEDTSLTFTAAGDAILFHREIKEAGMAENRPPLLVSQSYFRHGDRHRIENGEKVDKFVTDEFVAGVVYGGQVVVTNPTSSRQKLEILIQVPKGAIAVLGNRATGTQRVALEPYTTQRFEHYFYFPLAGQFPCYPAHVSKAGEVLAHADPFTFKVVDKLSKVDETSWAHISQWGTEEQVLAYLAKQNLHAIDLGQIAWRCRESAEFFKKAFAVLVKRGMYQSTLYSYGVHHGHEPAVREFLLMQGNFLSSCGLYLDSPLLVIDPVDRRAYEHLEYKPLVNNRAHPVGGKRKILNARIRGQYQRFLQILSQKGALDDSDQLSTAYYLFLQDRASEAMERLAAVKAEELSGTLQYNYFNAYAAFYRGEPGEARAIAMEYANYPVDRWRERFAAVVAQADEIEGKGPQVVSDENRDQEQARLAAQEPTLEVEADGASVLVTYQNVENVQVNYYEMDLEFLFSNNPFVSSSGGGFSVVRPNKSERLQLAKTKRNHRIELPREYQSKNVLVEVIGGGKKRSQAVFSNELETSVSERYGQLTVRHVKDGRPLPGSYVKVYALTNNGPQFYKDGYTDLRGKFDYASVSTSDIGGASKFSVLVMSDDHGAIVFEAPVPQR